MNGLNVLISLNLPDVYVKRIQDVSVNIKVQKSNDMNELLNLVKDADVLFAGIFSRELFMAARELKWIQTFFTGVESYLLPEVVKSDVIVTSAGGVNSIPVSEHAIGLMICLNRKFHLFMRNQIERRWKTSDAELVGQIAELTGKTVGIIGLGKIGMEIAIKAKCLGMKVIATRRNMTASGPNYVDRIVSSENLKELLAESDFVVLSLPLTKDTDGIIGEAELKSMKDTSYLVNVSRGKLVREDKLIQALRDGWIAGAGLDVFATEPLPHDSPLWDMKNVIITPHVAGLTPHYLDRLTSIFCENLKRFMRGEEMINVVNKKLGY